MKRVNGHCCRRRFLKVTGWILVFIVGFWLTFGSEPGDVRGLGIHEIWYEHGWPYTFMTRQVTGTNAHDPASGLGRQLSWAPYGIPALDLYAWPVGGNVLEFDWLKLTADFAVMLIPFPGAYWLLAHRHLRISLRGFMLSFSLLVLIFGWFGAAARRHFYEKSIDHSMQSDLGWDYEGPLWLSRLVGGTNLNVFCYPTYMRIRLKHVDDIHQDLLLAAKLGSLRRVDVSRGHLPKDFAVVVSELAGVRQLVLVLFHCEFDADALHAINAAVPAAKVEVID